VTVPRSTLGIGVAFLASVGVLTLFAFGSASGPPTHLDRDLVAGRLLFPLPASERGGLRDSFHEKRGLRMHEAVDIMAPRGTQILAVGDGKIVKLFRSVPGGKTIYQFDATETYAYYYAHLDQYADGLKEGAYVKRGDVIGYVGSTGNAPANAPHLHFAIFKLGPQRQWWKGEPIDPYPYFAKPISASQASGWRRAPG